MQLLRSNSCTSGSVHEDKYFWSFPHRGMNNLTPYALRMLGLDPPLPIWSAILSLLDTLKEEKLKSKETIVHFYLICLCLSLHPFVPLEHIVLLFPRLPFPCDLAIERWTIEVVETQVEDLVSPIRRSVDRVCHYCISVLLIEISISYPIHVHKYEYCIHGCICFLIHG